MTPDRLQTLRDKHKDRANRLDAILCPLLGMRVSHLQTTPLARTTMDQVQGRLLAAIFGDVEPSPEVPDVSGSDTP